ncbi:MAG TPA: VOC family protein [Labilithrix sp.]|nr:VOC family protein [Labilithrix sp.]
MHRSRVAGFIIDCKDADLDKAATFWSEALGMKSLHRHDDLYEQLDASERDLHVEVQTVRHESRIHLDIETDDIDAEVARLERLGATRVEKCRSWWVMQAPTGQRFCVVRARDLSTASGARTWE